MLLENMDYLSKKVTAGPRSTRATKRDDRIEEKKGNSERRISESTVVKRERKIGTKEVESV